MKKNIKYKGLFKSTLFKISCLILILGFLLRIALLFSPTTIIGYSTIEWMKIFILGTFNDLFFSILSFIPFALMMLFFSEQKYKKKWKYIIPIFLFLSYIILRFFNTNLREFNPHLTKIICYIILWKLLSYSIRLIFPEIRIRWRQYTYYIIFYTYTACLLFNAVAEFVFWGEFGVRYNFIAVDYLIYTSEVIGNFFESFPMIPFIIVVAVFSGAISYFMLRKTNQTSFQNIPSFKKKVLGTIYYLILAGVCYALLCVGITFQHGENNYVNELQANGCVKFIQAYSSNKLSYNEFYTKIPLKEARKILSFQYGTNSANTLQINNTKPELHKNIVLITIESMSADYLTRFGNKQHLTPNLDRLMQQGLCFDNLYAVGNRTVRGLEAVTLCIPPSPGESIIKQKNNSGLFSISKVLHTKGYNVQFFYGGDSYFDNMKTFFKGNGYSIIDQNNFTKKESTFSTVWGLCDEDLFNKAINMFNQNAKSGKPFFANIMTVSNHRPFTYPDGRIDIPSKNKCREGGVKYTDYAIGKFLKKASQQPWFKNTLFIITADHCASSAGSTDIPLEEYHIPAVFYSPGFIKPEVNLNLMSQIDIMPTAFGLLHFKYKSHFYGQNVLSPQYCPRAFAATYQDLGYLENHHMVVLSPGRRQQEFELIQTKYSLITGKEQKVQDTQLLYHAIANYETISSVLK